ncbi:MAG TPA: TetR/AcrR family transcriptional regulator [Alphaproteobacteria bacterium]|nr:TetR/AcrR family transcriptional regulator [Alphaproteobacteria bacterium]
MADTLRNGTIGEVPRRGRRVAAGARRDPDATKSKILAAAWHEFAQKGFAGARVDAIAARSGANKRMIYHYFGDKEGLFVAVLEAAYDRVRSAELALDLEHMEPLAAMRRMVEFTFDSFVKDRSFIQLLNNENLYKARHLKKSTRIARMHSPLIGMIDGILRRGVAAGVFRAGIDPTQLWISIAALGYFYFSNIHTLSTIFDRDLAEPMALSERRAHVVQLVLDALRPGRTARA